MTPGHGAARFYRRHGLRPIPIEPRGKLPLVRWEPFQSRAPTDDEIDGWFSRWPDANVAITTGTDLAVIDLDGGPAAEALLSAAGVELPAGAPRVRTGNGEHVYIAWPADGGEIRNRAAIVKGAPGPNGEKPPAVDCRGTGGYVLAPPSVHPSGRIYAWADAASLSWPLSLPAASPALLSLLRSDQDRAGTSGRADPNAPPGGTESAPPADPYGPWVERALRGVGEGERNDTAARLAGYFLRNARLPLGVVRGLLEQFAARCRPPLDLREVRTTVESIARAERRSGFRRAAASTDATDRPAATALRIADVMTSVLADAENPAQGIPWPIARMNRLILGGMMPGELVYLGGRPGLGKTLLAIQLAIATARMGRRVGMLSREMLAVALGRRILGQEAMGTIKPGDLRMGRADLTVAAKVAATLAELPVWISDDARTTDDLRGLLEENPVDLLIVDYLQLLEAPKGLRERRHGIEAISKALKAIATETPIPVVALSSLSRPTFVGKAGQPEPPPGLAALRESGELEHDADTIVFLHRPLPNAPGIQIIVAKNREGETGAVDVMIDRSSLLFREISWRPADADAPPPPAEMTDRDEPFTPPADFTEPRELDLDLDGESP